MNPLQTESTICIAKGYKSDKESVQIQTDLVQNHTDRVQIHTVSPSSGSGDPRDNRAGARRYTVFPSPLASTTSAAARLQPMRRSRTSWREKAPCDSRAGMRGAVMAKKSARSTSCM